MTTRRGSQYSFQSAQGEIRSRNDPKKWKRKGKVPSGTKSSQGSSISNRQVLEILITSGPYLELNMSNLKINKSYSEGSNRHINEPVQELLHTSQRKGLVNVTPNPPRSD
ncbi:hypothetical protein O181_095299 [Austropuccinia psidii MF-1]|uniref:Uncharacterized protein n=1 Tax=Austropuccinia psidii MF-1 TaxID=1389203 RepID=A0A9Q3J4U3_9BASI|nr:hypothetical protein [Austropuccinia psidii MF-1]